MFGKKKKEIKKPVAETAKDDAIDMITNDEIDLNEKIKSYQQNVRTPKDCLAPSEISVVDDETLKVGENYVRNYVMQGYPNAAYVGWLDKIYSYGGDLDTMVYVVPADDRKAADALTRQITALESQRQIEAERGSISNLSKYDQKIQLLKNEKASIEMNNESLYNVGIFSNLVCPTKEELDKEGEQLESALQGQRMNFMPTALRMVSGYKTALPLMDQRYEDKLRNFNTGAVVGCFPFYNAEMNHPGGVLMGINSITRTPMFINFYDKHSVNNTNISIFGIAGSGKTYFVSLLTLRSALKGVHTAIIDPEGEYRQIAKAAGGINIEISVSSKAFINAFDLEEEQEVDEDGRPTGRVWVDVKTKISDLLDLIRVMCKDQISIESQSLISFILQELYANFGITEDPASLYEQVHGYDDRTGELSNTGIKKRMPQFSDFHDLLLEKIEEDPGKFGSLRSVANQLMMYRKEGTYGLFDCQSSVDTSLFARAPVINFDVSHLDEGTLRPIGMYIATSYIWEKIIKKNFKTKKRLVVDEAWMMINSSFPGHEATARFLETCARRIRKRNAGLCVASQNFVEFASCSQGKAVLTNTAVRIFLKQSETDILELKNEFNLSDGEVEYLREAKTGEFLLKTDQESTIGVAISSQMERKLLTEKNAVQMR